MNAIHRCWAEVDLDALRGNLLWIRHRVGPEVKILTVVKADAYGHGLKQIAALLMQSGTDFFGVANLTEARILRGVGKGWPVLMLGACLPGEIETAVRDGIRPTLSDPEEAVAFSRAAVRHKTTLPVHVKIDLGMGRLGVSPVRAIDLLRSIRHLAGLRLEGLYTHYSSAEDDAVLSRKQARCFRQILDKVRQAGLEIPLIHANNSAAILHQPQTTCNLVRPGLLVYGVCPQGLRIDSSRLQHQLHPALAFKCRVSLVKTISKATPLSYGGTFVAPRRLRVATLTAGYGDGYLRAGSNRACVLVGGCRCRVLGRITMDQTIVDVSKVEAVVPGDEAVLIGSQGDEIITANEVAGWARTVPWEVLTAITYRVPRLYRGGQAA